MIQIVGFIGCLYLLVKAFEIMGSSAHRRESGSLNGAAVLAVLLAILGSVGFAFLLFAQGIVAPVLASGAVNETPRASSNWPKERTVEAPATNYKRDAAGNVVCDPKLAASVNLRCD